MVKEMGSDWDPWHFLNKKSNQLLVKLLLSAFLMGLSFRLFFSRSASSSLYLPLPGITNADKTTNTGETQVRDNSSARGNVTIARGNVTFPMPPELGKQDTRKGNHFGDNSDAMNNVSSPAASDFDGKNFLRGDIAEKCDLFSGEWIPNPKGPTYTHTSCPFIEEPQNCLKNGRPDTGYLYWRWKPNGCHLPPFDANRFLRAMRNKTWALIGDSILRNHAQSLVCLLSKAELPVEISHEDNYKSRKWYFSSHNFTLSLIWSPFLVNADIFENDEGVSTSEIQLHLDILNSRWTHAYHTFDYVVLSTGQWFAKTAIYWENHEVIGCHYCHGKNLTELGSDYAYSRALQVIFSFLRNNRHKPLVLYRTWTPDHFENGEWWSGGTCNRTGPYKNGEYDGKDVDHRMHRIELEEFERAKANGSEERAHLELLDTYRLSLLRPDGHSGPYRVFHPFDGKSERKPNDCLHWCLPGPIDTWNDVLMEIVMNY